MRDWISPPAPVRPRWAVGRGCSPPAGAPRGATDPPGDLRLTSDNPHEAPRDGTYLAPSTNRRRLPMQTLDETKVEAFAGLVAVEAGAAVNAALVNIGDRLGLYRAMADS